ncbi:hypothetical protein D3C80_2016470 [compost metagenome]
MAAGKPVLMAVDGDAADLVAAAGCGVVGEWENPESLAEAAMTLMQLTPEARLEMGKKGYDYYQQKLSLRVGVERFGAHFQRLSK